MPLALMSHTPQPSSPASDIRVELMKFLAVGSVNFVLTLGIFTGLMHRLGAHYLVALLAAWSFGMVFYVTNFVWVFKPEDNLHFRARFVRFIISSLFTIALNTAFLSFAVERLQFDALYAQFGFIPVIVILNFSLAKYWSLRRNDNRGE